MKNNIVFKSLLMILFVATMFSCNKDSLINELTTEPNTIKTTNTIKHFTAFQEDEMRVLFNTLTPEERKTFWLNHMNEFIDATSLSTAQLNSMNELINFISTNTFDETISTVGTPFILTWLSTAELLFTPQQLSIILFSGDLQPTVAYTGSGGSGGGGGGTNDPPTGKKCNCYKENLLWECSGLSTDKCTSNTCDASTWGCGVLWWSACDGLCVQYP